VQTGELIVGNVVDLLFVAVLEGNGWSFAIVVTIGKVCCVTNTFLISAQFWANMESRWKKNEAY
jgi:preprotein translocase subunit SecF